MNRVLHNRILALFCLILPALPGLAQIHLQENFNGNALPASWSVLNEGTGACQWMVHQPYTNGGTNIAMLGSNFLFVNSDSSGTLTVAKETITSPVIDYGTATSVYFSFSHYYRDRTGTNRRDTGFVEVFDGANWVALRTIADVNVGTGTAPVREKINISAYLNPGLQVRFRYVSNRAYYWAIDDVVISTPPPIDLGVKEITNISSCGIPSTIPVKVKLVNYGSAAQANIPVTYRVNNYPPVSEQYTSTINPGDSALFTFNTPFVAPSPGAYQFTAWTAYPGDGLPSNDTSKTVTASTLPNAIPTVDFTGYTGGNIATVFPGWTEQTGYQPSGTTSSWTNALVAQATAFGSNTARINLYGSTKRDWLITKPVSPVAGSALRFKIALTNNGLVTTDSMGSDDSLIVKVSTNCGLTWLPLRHYTAEDQLQNTLTSQLLDLSAFEGQPLLIAFFGSEGSVNDLNDYDIHIDDVEVVVPLANDLGVSQVVVPNQECGVADPFQVVVKVYNNGTQTQTSIPLSYQLAGQAAVSQTFSGNLPTGGQQEFVFTTPVNFTTPGTFALSVWSSAAGDANTANDSSYASLTRNGTAIDNVGFTGFTGANLATVFPGWKEQNGATPTGTTSTWQNSSATQTNAFGSTTARVNLYGTFRREWLIGPAINPVAGTILKVKAAVTNLGLATVDSMGSDDSVHVMVTPDCGVSWVKVHSFSKASGLTNQLTEAVVSLNAFAGQTIRVAFYATDGSVDNPNDYDFHIDDVTVLLPLPNDIGVAGIQLPVVDCGTPSALVVKVMLTNSGLQPQSGFPVSYRLNSQPPVTETFTGTLAPGASQTFVFTAPADLSISGTYNLKAWTGLPSDQNVANDTASNQISTSPTTLAQVDFTTFNGDNLATTQPGWSEQSGQTPTGTTSTWTNSTTSQATALGSGTARIGLTFNTKRDWIISPNFLASAMSQVSFRLAVTDRSLTGADQMGSDDSLNVMVSTDCGLTWSRMFSFTAASALPNTLTPFTLSLGAFAGQNIRIGFFATEGNVNDVNDYDLHLDAISISIGSAVQEAHRGNTLHLYPNPAKDQVTIAVGTGEAPDAQANVAIFSADGRLVGNHTLSFQTGKASFDIEALPPGVYTVQVVQGIKVRQARLSIVR